MDFFQRLGNFFTGKGWINDDEKRRKEQQVQPQVVQQNNIQPQLNNTNRVLNAGYGMNGVENRQRLLNGSNANPSPSSNPLQQANQATQQLNLNSQNNQLKPQVTVNDAPKVFNSQGQQDWANNQNKQIQVQNAVNKPIQPQQPVQQPKPQLVQPQQQKPQVQPQTSKPQPTFFDYLNPLGKYGLFGAENQKNFSNVIKPATDAIQRYEDTVDKGDKQQGFQWDDPMDYLRFGAKLPSGMARGVMEAPNKISAGISGVRVNDQGKVEDLNALQRIGSAADGGIDLFGVPFGGSGTLVKSVLKQGGEEAVKQSAKQIAKQAWQQKVIDTAKHIGSDAIKEGAEETIQSFAGDLADDGKLNTDWRQHASAGALGALGGGMMATAGKGINATRNKVFSNQQATNNDVDITKPGRLEQEALVQRQNKQQSQQPIQPQQQSQTQTQTTTNTATNPVNNQQTGYSSFFRRPAENSSIRQAAEVNIANNQNNKVHPIQSVNTNQAIRTTMPNASPALKQAVSQNISDIQRGDTNSIAARQQTTGKLENYLVEQATQNIQNTVAQDVRYKLNNTQQSSIDYRLSQDYVAPADPKAKELAEYLRKDIEQRRLDVVQARAEGKENFARQIEGMIQNQEQTLKEFEQKAQGAPSPVYRGEDINLDDYREFNERPTDADIETDQLIDIASEKIADDLNEALKLAGLNDDIRVEHSTSRSSEANYITFYDDANDNDFTVRIANHYKAYSSGSGDLNITLSDPEIRTFADVADRVHEAFRDFVDTAVNSDTKYKLSPEQEAFFKDSKIRDENGNLKTVYHGTNSEFDQFSPLAGSSSSTRNRWGEGNYLAYDKDMANDYGVNLKEMYANITSPISNKQKTISFDQYDALHRRINDGEPAYREDYDMYDNDMDLLWDITDNGQWKKYAQDIKDTTGKDGVIMDDMAITFSPNQTKYTNNLNPTDNSDMRYKLAEKADEVKNSIDKLKARYFQLTGDNKIAFDAFAEAIQDMGNIEGYYDPKTDEVHIGKLADHVLNHEVVHKTIHKYAQLQPELLKDVANRYGIENVLTEYNQKGYGKYAVNGRNLDINQRQDVDLALEEKLADEFNTYLDRYQKGQANYYANKVGLSPTIRAWFDRIIEGLKDFFGQADKIKQFYAQLETGKFADKRFGNSEQLVGNADQLESGAAYKIHETPNGKLVEIEGNPLKGIPARNIPRKVREVIKERFQGNTYPIGDTGDVAKVTARSKNEISHQQSTMSHEDYRTKATAAHQIDELMSSMTRIKHAPNLKKAKKPNVASYTYGDVAVKIGDRQFTVRVNIENWNNGNKTLYDISSIKETSPQRINLLSGGDVNSSTIPNTPQNVNNDNRYKLEEDDSFYDKPRPSVQDVWGTNSVSLEYSQDENGNLGINVTPENTNDPNSITHKIQETPTDSKSLSAQRPLTQANRRSLHETVESQPLNQNQAQEFKNVPMEEEHLLTKGNLYEQTKPGINDTWNRAFRDGMYEYRQHTKRTRDGKKHFVSFERRYVGDDGEYGDWMPTSRAAYIWKSQTKKIDKVNRDQIIQEALKAAKQDGEVQEFMAYKNPDSAGGVAVVPLVGEHSIDGGFVRNPKTGAIEGNYIQVTPFGVVHQTNGKFDVIEADHLTSALDRSKGGITDTFNRLVEKNVKDELGQKLLKDLYYQKTEAYANYADEINNLLDKHATLAKYIDKARPRFVSSKKFWEDIGAYTEGKFPVGSADENMNAAFSKKYGPQAAKRVREYDTFMRKNYDAMISNLNSVRRMYGKEEIPYLKNYMPHIQKRSNILGRAVDKLLAAVPTGVRGDMEGQARGEIPASIAGLSADFKPTHKFNANEKQRRGGMMDYEKDPRKAFEYYADVMLYNTHMEPVIARGRQIEASMRAIDMAKKSGTNIDPDSNLAKGDKISSKATIAVQNFVNEMAGKSSSLDRPYIDQTNKWVQSIQRLESVNGANKILGNLSSTLAQTLNLPETVRDNGLRSTGRAFLTAFDKSTKEAIRKSPFLRERYTDTDGKFTRSRYQKATDKISVVSGMNLVEKKFIQLNWAANYYSAQRKGLTGYQLIKAADQATERAVGGRGVGAMPQVYKSTLGKMFLQFTYETNESWKNNIANVKRFGSEIRQLQFKDAGGTATRAAEAFAVAYGMNMLMKLVTGNEPLANMYDAIKDVLSNDADDDGEDDKLGQKIARIGSEMSKMNPVTSAALNLIPKSEREKMFGKSSDLGRFDGATGVAQTAANILGAGFYATQGDSENTQKNLQGLIPVGNQIKKTMSGIKVLQDGGDVYTDKNGKEHTNFEVDSGNAWNQAKALLFGKNALRPDEKSASTSTAAGDDTGKTIKDFERGLKKGTYKIQYGLLVNKSGNVQRSYYKSLAEGQGVSDEAYSNWMKAYNIDGASTIKKEFSSSNDILNKLENGEKKANKAKSAVDILMGKHKDLPDWVRERYYRESGYTKEQIEYGAMTTHKEVSLMDNYWRQKAQESSHEELIQALTNGRRKSIVGQMFAKNGIINKLRAEGYITKWEAKALNAAQFDVDGNRITKEASGGSSRSGSGRSRGGRGDRSANSGIASIGIKAAANISSLAPKASQTSVGGMSINQIGQNLISKMNTQKQVDAALKQWKSPRIRVKKA